MELEILKNTTPPTVFIRSPPSLMRALSSMGGYRLLLFLAIDHKMWHCEILTLKSMGKILKCAISVITCFGHLQDFKDIGHVHN